MSISKELREIWRDEATHIRAEIAAMGNRGNGGTAVPFPRLKKFPSTFRKLERPPVMLLAIRFI